MVTRVGMQEEFADALYELCELDYDAIAAYQTAITRLENQDFKSKFEQFKSDHERHIRELRELLEEHHEEFPEGPGARHLLAQGKASLTKLTSDDAILRAMLANEEDTNTAYQRLNTRVDEWEDAKDILRRGLEDERRHKKWFENLLYKNSQNAA